ncbi:uncharacterized protein MYCGRDRAFT_82331 [Zymoseptoria tritici IPO323]|uniref:Uncharacterized protein n=1 Tax=Zymoseptoria tritici (strain CBS 115943 / IPO323) TaxID=336722 RepID=F9XLL3_ZYMTI|nr:uncharacterized protein MYCGRDRAFT_82331 [Zymoseptoria tritici IPO323]EGP83799.1 hypothetical protein MYCGRDRAFT_82331 [Zymoseptoria tritici IPO323]
MVTVTADIADAEALSLYSHREGESEEELRNGGHLRRYQRAMYPAIGGRMCWRIIDVVGGCVNFG